MEDYTIESIIKSRKGDTDHVHIVDHYKPGDMHSCYSSIKRIVGKIYDVIDELNRTSEMFMTDLDVDTDLVIKIKLLGPKNQEIYEIIMRDEVVFYIADILCKMNYLI